MLTSRMALSVRELTTHIHVPIVAYVSYSSSAEVKILRLNDFLFSSGLDNINLFKVSPTYQVYSAHEIRTDMYTVHV